MQLHQANTKQHLCTCETSTSGDIATMKYHWQSSGPGELLMMALPHHLDTLTSPTIPSHSYKVLKGTMVGVTGDIWEFQENLTPISWTAPRAVPEKNIEDIKAALAEDVVKAHSPGDDPYFGGKKMAVLARLSLIADELGATEIAEKARERFRPYLEVLLSSGPGPGLAQSLKIWTWAIH